MSNTEELLANWSRPERNDNERTIGGDRGTGSNNAPLGMFSNDDEDIDEQILRLAAVPEPYGRMAARQSLGVLDEMERNARGQALESKQQEARLTELAAQVRKLQGESEMYKERETQLMDENSSLKRKVSTLERQLKDGYPQQTARLLEENGLLREKLSKYRNLYEQSLKKPDSPQKGTNEDSRSSVSMDEIYSKIEEMFKRTASPPKAANEVKNASENEGMKTEADFKKLFSDMLHRMEATDATQKETQVKNSTRSEKVVLEQLIKRLINKEIAGIKGKQIPDIRPQTAPMPQTVVGQKEEEEEEED